MAPSQVRKSCPTSWMRARTPGSCGRWTHEHPHVFPTVYTRAATDDYCQSYTLFITLILRLTEKEICKIAHHNFPDRFKLICLSSQMSKKPQRLFVYSNLSFLIFAQEAELMSDEWAESSCSRELQVAGCQTASPGEPNGTTCALILSFNMTDVNCFPSQILSLYRVTETLNEHVSHKTDGIKMQKIRKTTEFRCQRNS